MDLTKTKRSERSVIREQRALLRECERYLVEHVRAYDIANTRSFWINRLIVKIRNLTKGKCRG